MLSAYSKLGNKRGGLLTRKVLQKAKKLVKQEKDSYQAAYLAQFRQAMLPYLQRQTMEQFRREGDGEVVDWFPEEEEETQIMKQLYEDVNDLYTDEHKIMAQSDLLEQVYNLMHEINMEARNHLIIRQKREDGGEADQLLDPNQFPIQNL